MLLYIHIPFCAKKCDYCDFLSFANVDEKVKKDYIDALLVELGRYKKITKKFDEITSIFIGGGTPSALSPFLLEKLLAGISKVVFDACANINGKENGLGATKGCIVGNLVEYTVECNPGTLDKEKLEIMKKYGVNRISMGLQSGNDEELKSLGRIHGFEDFVESYNLVRQAGFLNVNVDIMSALPGQSLESYKETLEKVTRLEPEHISAYSLIIEEGTPFFDIYGKYGSLLPDEDTEREMYYLTKQFLEEKGYYRYEISNYSKPGYECKHNVGYWVRDEYVGVGLGAASLVGNRRIAGIRNLQDYINAYLGNDSKNLGNDNVLGDDNNFREDKKSWNDNDLGDDKICIENIEKLDGEIFTQEIIELSVSDQMSEFMFLRLRLTKGISVSDFAAKFGKDIFEVYGEEIDKSINEGLLVRNGDILKLTEKGLDVSNMVFERFV